MSDPYADYNVFELSYLDKDRVVDERADKLRDFLRRGLAEIITVDGHSQLIFPEPDHPEIMAYDREGKTLWA